jgi:hypothetical protein
MTTALIIMPRKPPAKRLFRIIGPPLEPEAAPVVSPPEAAPAPTPKRGRKPINGAAMTAAERKASSRANQQAAEIETERQSIIKQLMEIYDRQASSVMFVGPDGKRIAGADHRIAHDRQQRRSYLEGLEQLSLEDLKLALAGKNTPDSRGTLPGESSGGKTGETVAKIIDADTQPFAIAVKPSGVSSEMLSKGKLDRWQRVPAKELEKQKDLEKKFKDMAAKMFSDGRCHVPDWCMYDKTPCSFVALSPDGAIEHLWAEYYAGEKLWDNVDKLADPEIAHLVGPLLADARKNTWKAVHHWVICNWLRSESKPGPKPKTE